MLTACTLNEFTCDNEKCINGTKHCDGVYDCTDQSDEKNCATPSPTPTPGKIIPQYNRLIIKAVIDT